MDGQFVTNITLGPVVIEGIRQADVAVSRYALDDRRAEPLRRRLPRRRLRRHHGCNVEACARILGATRAAVRETGAASRGLSLNPDTAARALEFDYLDDIRSVALDDSFPGRAARASCPRSCPRSSAPAEVRASSAFRYAIEVDGRHQPENRPPGPARRGRTSWWPGAPFLKHPPYASPIGHAGRGGGGPAGDGGRGGVFQARILGRPPTGPRIPATPAQSSLSLRPIAKGPRSSSGTGQLRTVSRAGARDTDI
jgi:hypothetical protein